MTARRAKRGSGGEAIRMLNEIGEALTKAGVHEDSYVECIGILRAAAKTRAEERLLRIALESQRHHHTCICTFCRARAAVLRERVKAAKGKR